MSHVLDLTMMFHCSPTLQRYASAAELPGQLSKTTAVLQAANGAPVYVLGISHVSKESCQQIEQLIRLVQPGEGSAGHYACYLDVPCAPGSAMRRLPVCAAVLDWLAEFCAFALRPGCLCLPFLALQTSSWLR